jgi:hypothetical protein
MSSATGATAAITATPPPPAAAPAATPYRLQAPAVDGHGGWMLYDGDHAIGVYAGGSGTARARAARDLAAKRGVRVVRWYHAGPAVYTPILGNPARGAWTVLELRSEDGLRFSARADGTWLGPIGIGAGKAPTGWPDRDSIEAAHGQLTPHLVHNLAALVAEVEMFRAVTVYYFGDMSCIEEGQCQYADEEDDGEVGAEPVFPCAHVAERIATWQEAVATQHAADLAKRWRKDHQLALAGAAEQPDLYTAAELAAYAAKAEAAAELEAELRADEQ